MNNHQAAPAAKNFLSASWLPSRGLLFILVTGACLLVGGGCIELLSSLFSRAILNSPLRIFLTHWTAQQPVVLATWLHAKTTIFFVMAGLLCAALALYPSRKESLGIWLNSHERISLLIIYLLYVVYVILPFCNPHFYTAPIVNGDHILHFTDRLETKAHLLHHGTVWGFDPFHCSGRVLSIVDNVWQALFFIMFSWLGNAAAYNLSIIAGFLIPPLLLYYSSRAFGITTIGRLCLMLLNCLMMAQYVPLRALFFVGMTGFAVSSYLCIFCLALTHRYCSAPSLGRAGILAVAGIITILIHPLSAFTFCLLCLPYFLTNWKTVRRRLPHLLLMTILPLAAAWYLWLGIQLSFDGIIFDDVVLQHTSLVKYLTDMFTMPALLIFNLFFAAMYYMAFKRIKSIAPLWGAILLSSLLCLILTSCGSQIGLGMTEPPRYVAPFSLLVALLLVHHLFRHSNMPSLPRILPIILLMTLLIPQGGYFGMQFGYESFPEAAPLINTLKGKGSASGRLLVQDINTDWYYGGGFAGSLPFFTNRESNVNLYPFFTPPEFVNDQLFGRPIRENTDAEILTWIRVLRVNRIMLYSPEARERFSALPGMTPVPFNGQFLLLQYNTPDTTRLLSGIAFVNADLTGLQYGIHAATLLFSHITISSRWSLPHPARQTFFPS